SNVASSHIKFCGSSAAPAPWAASEIYSIFRREAPAPGLSPKYILYSEERFLPRGCLRKYYYMRRRIKRGQRL
ncbi:MAG: hypothetical protein K2M39_05955, partial [Muribaculaceae bacterium]|nr:hypothetical protein [Muribaculaceae bacterium]